MNKQLKILWREFMKKVHPDMYSLEYQKETNSRFIKTLNEYLYHGSDETISLPYYYRKDGHIYSKQHKFLQALNADEIEANLQHLFLDDRSKLESDNDKLSKQKSAAVFHTLLHAYYHPHSK